MLLNTPQKVSTSLIVKTCFSAFFQSSAVDADGLTDVDDRYQRVHDVSRSCFPLGDGGRTAIRRDGASTFSYEFVLRHGVAASAAAAAAAAALLGLSPTALPAADDDGVSPPAFRSTLAGRNAAAVGFSDPGFRLPDESARSSGDDAVAIVVPAAAAACFACTLFGVKGAAPAVRVEGRPSPPPKDSLFSSPTETSDGFVGKEAEGGSGGRSDDADAERAGADASGLASSADAAAAAAAVTGVEFAEGEKGLTALLKANFDALAAGASAAVGVAAEVLLTGEGKEPAGEKGLTPLLNVNLGDAPAAPAGWVRAAGENGVMPAAENFEGFAAAGAGAAAAAASAPSPLPLRGAGGGLMEQALLGPGAWICWDVVGCAAAAVAASSATAAAAAPLGWLTGVLAAEVRSSAFFLMAKLGVKVVALALSLLGVQLGAAADSLLIFGASSTAVIVFTNCVCRTVLRRCASSRLAVYRLLFFPLLVFCFDAV